MLSLYLSFFFEGRPENDTEDASFFFLEGRPENETEDSSSSSSSSSSSFFLEGRPENEMEDAFSLSFFLEGRPTNKIDALDLIATLRTGTALRTGDGADPTLRTGDGVDTSMRTGTTLRTGDGVDTSMSVVSMTILFSTATDSAKSWGRLKFRDIACVNIIV